MKFPFYFSQKIALSKDSKKNPSRVIINISRLSVVLGIIVSLITVATGVGSKEAIKSNLGDFNGYITIKSTQSNSSYNSSVLDTKSLNVKNISALPEVTGIQKFITTNGIFRTEDNFAGFIFKGVGKDFDRNRFQKFLIEGKSPQYSDDDFSNEIIVSNKIASALNKKLNDSIVAVFSSEKQKQPIYRKFVIAGIYKTDIKQIDDLLVIGAINQARKIQGFEEGQIGGIEIFLKDLESVNKVDSAIENNIGIKDYAEKITDKFPQIVDWISIFDINMTLIIAIMLSVVVVNIIMILLILIIERTNSIGLLKTLGATNAQIRSVFINYTLIIMVPALIVGNIIGVGFLLIQKYYGIIKLNPDNYYVSEVPVDINPLSIIAISLGLLFISAISLILPSYLISKITPVKAIKCN